MTLFLVLCCFVSSGFSQDPLYVDFSEAAQLPSKTIYDLVEDSKGILWMATEVGVYSYNGREFKSYAHPKQVDLSVFNFDINDNDQLFYNNLANQVFYIHDQKQPELFTDLNSVFKGENTRLVTSRDYLIITGLTKVVFIDKKTRKEVFTYLCNSTFGRVPPFVLEGCFYSILKNGDFLKIDLTDFTTTTVSNPYALQKKFEVFSGATSFNRKEPLIFLNSKKNALAIVIKESGVTELPVAGAFPSKRIISSRFINEELWLATENGLYHYQLQNDTLKLEQQLFKDQLVTKIEKDYQGNYWVATHDYGIYIIPNILYRRAPFNLDNIPVKSHYNSRDTFIIQQLDNSISILNNTVKEIPITHKEDIKYVFENPWSNELYVFYSSNVRVLDSLKTEKIRSVNGVYKEVQFIDTTRFICSSNSRYGIYSIDPNEEYFFAKRDFERPGRSYGNAYDLTNNTAYFANIDGLYGVTSTYKVHELKDNGASIFAKDVLYDKENKILWVLKFKNGVLGFKNNQLVYRIDAEQGLKGEVNSYFYQYKNQLWILGNKGIQIYDIDKKTFREITNQDGLPSYDFKGIFIKNDKAFISTSQAVVSFQIDQFDKKQPGFNPYITSFIADNISYDPHSNIELPSDTKIADIFFNTNGYFSEDYITYKYKLNDAAWKNIVASTHVLSLNNLSSGDYNIKIKAVAENYESPQIPITFTVETPFYKHWFFLLCCIILFSFVLLKWYQTKNKRAQLKQQQEIERKNQELTNIQLKLENFRSQMNPHFIFNALNSIQDYILKNETKLARLFLVKFSRLIRIYLEHSQAESISLHEEVVALQLYLDLERDRFSNEFDYSFQYEGLINKHDVRLPAFLLQPYVENAVKHGFMHQKGEKTLTIKFKYSEGVLHISIKDTGIGRKKSHEINSKRTSSPSFSSKANEARISLLNKSRKQNIDLKIIDVMENETCKGTQIILKIPQDSV